jgi:aquaporin Z
MKDWQKYAAEAYGTFVLVGIGTGAILASGGDLVALSFAFGLALIAALFTVGRVSGGHFNPAVSLGMYLDKRLSMTDMLFYWVSQAVGAILASMLLAFVLSKELVAMTITQFAEPVDALGAFVGETVFTAVFVMAILVLARSRWTVAFLGIGLTLTAVHLAAAPFTGASVNPARSFAPALVGGEFGDIWVYLAGPAVGALVGWVLYKVIVTGDTDLTDDMPNMM